MSNIQYQKYKKEIKHLEWKIDALRNYIASVQPNYFYCNYAVRIGDYYNDESLFTFDFDAWLKNKQFKMAWEGAIFKHGLYKIYFLKSFNHRDLIWANNDTIYLNTTTTIDQLYKEYDQITSETEKESFINNLYNRCIHINNNSWIVINRNLSKKYFIIPAAVGNGDAYILDWKVSETGYDIVGTAYPQKLVEQGNDYFYFFFSPLQTRYTYNNKSSTNSIFNISNKKLTINYTEIQNFLQHYYQTHQTIMCETVYITKDSSQTIYEPININTSSSFDKVAGSGYRDYAYTIVATDLINFPSSSNISIGGYFW